VPIEQMTRTEIEGVVYDLILEDEFETYFKNCDD
jgi:hypothetical protein